MVESIRTDRLSIRCWQLEDAPLLKAAIDRSLPELQMWVPWALDEPWPLEAVKARITAMRAKFLTGEDWAFGVFDQRETKVLGGVGLHPRGRTDHLDVGYWIRTDLVGQGLAVEAAGAMCAVAFAHTTLPHVEIHCDADNRRSAAVARRLGFTLSRTFLEPAVTARGAERTTLVWTLPRGLRASGPGL